MKPGLKLAWPTCLGTAKVTLWGLKMTVFTHFLPETQIGRYGSWLKTLDPQTLRNYFGISLSAEGINRLIRKFKQDKANHHFLIAHRDSHWAGVIHIASLNDAVEFGVIVKQEFRRQGIADQLLSEAITWAQNRGYRTLYMHCVIENQAIRYLCSKHGLQSRNIYGDIEGHMRLPRANWRSLWREYWQRQTNWYYFVQERLKTLKAT